jgi:hypothetical protein
MKSKTIFYLTIPFLMTSCVTLYKPNVINSPMLRSKGEANVETSIGINGNGRLNLQGSYAVSDNLGLMLNGMYHLRRSSSSDSSSEKLDILFGEVGAGYFTTFGEDNIGLFQCYGGGGYGWTQDVIEKPRQIYPKVSSRYVNFFVQPGVGLSRQFLDMAFDLKVNYVQLFDIQAQLYDEFDWWNTDFRYYSDTTLSFVNLEPSLTIRAGGKNWKGVAQVGVIVPTINPDSYFAVNTVSYLGFSLIKFSLGVNYFFGRKLSEKP